MENDDERRATYGREAMTRNHSHCTLIYYIMRKLPRNAHFLHTEFGSKVIARRLGPGLGLGFRVRLAGAGGTKGLAGAGGSRGLLGAGCRLLRVCSCCCGPLLTCGCLCSCVVAMPAVHCRSAAARQRHHHHHGRGRRRWRRHTRKSHTR
jgi:hypothetical protein